MSHKRPTVLLSSGFPRETLDVVGREFQVLDIPEHGEALAYLQQCKELPAAVVVGFAVSNWPESPSAPPGGLPAQRMLEAIQALDRDLPVIISTANEDPAAIVAIIKRGGFDYLIEMPKPAEPERLMQYNQQMVLALTRAVQWRRSILENRQLRADMGDENLPLPIRVRSAAMHRVVDLARKVASTPATVLITGESGVGKELIARLIHGLSRRAADPYLAVNCGALTDPLLNAELFGHVKGAFTGADANRDGLIREAGAGTMLLDEIATISPAMQVTLLRVLEERRARPVGGAGDYAVNCRFLAAANQSLDRLVADGRFREDLFYRLNVFHIHVPPLRERPEDIAVLAQHFLLAAAREFGRPVDGFAPDALAWLEQQRWPGNARQLRNVVERAVILSEASRITLADVSVDSPGEVSVPGLDPAAAAGNYDQAMRRFERNLLRRCLEQADGNISAAARELGMKRTTLTYRLRKLGLGD